uniref:SAM-dependent MTase TRM10-type domain-containing protein n=1 Tax=Mesocestoides corti TaxID=53468 RepID=A0A5K3FVT9_MESCO
MPLDRRETRDWLRPGGPTCLRPDPTPHHNTRATLHRSTVAMAVLSWCSTVLSRSTLKIIFNGKRYLRDSRVTIAPYLLNRTKPPEDILNNLTSEDAARLDLIRAEHNMFIASGKAVPPSLSAGDYLELLCCPSVSARNRYYLFRFKVFQRREAKRLEQLSKATTKVC